jgi:voltage-gated sodium channel
MKASELTFLLLYSLELVLKMIVHRGYFFIGKNASWNTFDFALVCISLESHLLRAQEGTRNLTFLRILRILKMAKFLRVFRLMRFLHELRLIMNSLLGSLVSLFWSVVAMALIFYMFGLVFVQGTTIYFIDMGSDLDPDVEALLRLYFGSVETAIITLFKATTGGDDWTTFYDALLPTANGWIFITFVCFSHIALMNILTGLFVEKAMKLAEPDREVMFFEKRKVEIHQMEEITKLCVEMDIDRNGVISHEEFQRQMSTPGSKLRTYLGTLGLTRDAELFYKMVKTTKIDNAAGIEVDTFVRACMKLKGGATSLDMQALTMQTKRIQRQLDDLLRFQSRQLDEKVPASAIARLMSVNSRGFAKLPTPATALGDTSSLTPPRPNDQKV